jgi:hypothetical protein
MLVTLITEAHYGIETQKDIQGKMDKLISFVMHKDNERGNSGLEPGFNVCFLVRIG